MATYEEIYGKRVEVLDADPTLNSSYEGQVWYNSATGTLKSVVSFAAFSTGSPTINVFGYGGWANQGTQTAAFIAGPPGSPAPAPTGKSSNEYNGTGWTSGGNLNNGRFSIGSCGGTQTSCIITSGSPGTGLPAPTYNFNESYNGTAFSTETAFGTARGSTAGGGTSETACIAATGDFGPPGVTTATESWNGSSWTSLNSAPTATRNAGSTGVLTSLVVMGGTNNPTVLNFTAEFDGTNWTAGTNYPAANRGATGAGSASTAALIVGGNAGPPGTVYTEAYDYDGTTYTDIATILTPKMDNALGCGTTTAALFAAGPQGPPVYNNTQEFNRSINTITPGAWAAGGNLNTARSLNATATNAPQDAGLTFGGNWPSVTADTEEYNGTTWAEQTNLPQALTAAAGAGTQTAGLCTTGRTPGGRLNNTYEYDGSSWTAGGNYTATQAYTSGAGTQTAGLAVGGETPPGTDLTTSSEYNGSSWTAGNACNTPGYLGPVFGSAAGAIYSCVSGPPTSLESEAYDGTNWTSGPTTIFSNNQGGGAGTFPTGIIFGGPSGAPSTGTQGWDGSTWSTRPSLGTARRAKGAGTSAGGLAMGGETPSSPTSNSTEEFTPESTAVTAKTLTTS